MVGVDSMVDLCFVADGGWRGKLVPLRPAFVKQRVEHRSLDEQSFAVCHNVGLQQGHAEAQANPQELLPRI